MRGADSSQIGGLFSPAHPKSHSSTSATAPRRRPDGAPPRTTSGRRQSSPGTNSAAHPDHADRYHRVTCPAAAGRSAARCGLVDDPGPVPDGDPDPAAPPPACCTRQTLTISPDVAAKPGRNRYPSAARRRSYTRRTGAERGFSTIKDPATNAMSRGWSRLMGLTPTALWLAALHAIRTAHPPRVGHPPGPEQRRAAAGLPPRTANAAGNHPDQPHRIAITTRRRTASQTALTSTPPAGPPLRPARGRSAARQRPATRKCKINWSRQTECQTRT